ncbi:glycosyl transferase [Microtetraspora sp. NBRC 13810]|uniref:nucleotide disphospho-sugar-binding domain-containing protein n=1 Tax=Microtetraspora sp. NBRC 13810 TaxID=3030990 RepID=UPI0024A2801C|nr:nucleotide disphospho-sugar-binding domain-containing protein [Microtetraspora sp. NBRC 13810]GLW05787.1 glycosyl transferase [Microtetraspora sp. NBRC 13810]
MRVIFAPWPAPAHLYPMIPLAWALQAAGHEVCIAAPPAIKDDIVAAGLTAVTLGPESAPVARAAGMPRPPHIREQMDRLTESLDLAPAERDPWDVFQRFMLPGIWNFHPAGVSPKEPNPVVDDFVEFARAWRPDLVLWDPGTPSGAVAALASGAAHARMMWGLDYFGWTIERFAERRDRPALAGVDDPMTEAVRPIAEKYGFEVDDEMLYGQWTVDPTPAGIRLPVAKGRTLSVRWVPYTGASAMPEWLHGRPERPRVGVSLGLSRRMYFRGGWTEIPKVMEMVSDLDIEVVATLNEEQIGGTPVPDNVRVVEYVPLTQLLPTCSAFIHHGGFGTFAAASALRTPQIILDSDEENGLVDITIEEDGTEWSVVRKHPECSPTAAYVNAHNAGLGLHHKVLPVDTMRKQLLRVLEDPTFQNGARGVYEDLQATPSPAEIVPMLERLTAHYRRRG